MAGPSNQGQGQRREPMWLLQPLPPHHAQGNTAIPTTPLPTGKGGGALSNPMALAVALSPGPHG